VQRAPPRPQVLQLVQVLQRRKLLQHVLPLLLEEEEEEEEEEDKEEEEGVELAAL
jgi:hypothetical protein